MHGGIIASPVGSANGRERLMAAGAALALQMPREWLRLVTRVLVGDDR